ncbi:hypothetical protein ACOME3_002549 [Neoechinorhynchus agilis]
MDIDGQTGLKIDNENVNPKKILSVWNGAFVVIGTMVGSGIFISPKGIAEFSGSVGFSLIIWLISGVVSILGAQAYIELGTMLSECGGDYQYIQYTYGSFMGFMYAWIMIIVVIPASNAIAALTFANYV